ncbi:MAG: sensor domain-containing diguanylate cyclase [Acidobacteriota bacterium]
MKPTQPKTTTVEPETTERLTGVVQLPGRGQFHCLDPEHLERFLERRRAPTDFPLELSLAENLVEILRKANEFVPSAAGSILLDNPVDKHDERERNTLTFIAAFGSRADGLVGRTIDADRGIAGYAYRTGVARKAKEAHEDQLFFPGVDAETHYTTRSLVAIPIRIEKEVCGVLELINRHDAIEFSEHDVNLLEIFAGYISVSIQNVLDGRQANEIAKRDNLTGLYNDRYLHIALSDTIRQCRDEGKDLAVLFFDLDFFKRINDNHGHLAGSQVLRDIGELLRSILTVPDAIPARYGGDEFVLVVPGIELDAAIELAEDIRTAILASEFCSSSGEIQPEPLHLTGLTCSVGLATLRHHTADDSSVDTSRSNLLRLADAAMYVAKETGRNRTAIAGAPVRRRR